MHFLFMNLLFIPIKFHIAIGLCPPFIHFNDSSIHPKCYHPYKTKYSLTFLESPKFTSNIFLKWPLWCGDICVCVYACTLCRETCNYLLSVSFFANKLLDSKF